MDRDKLKCIICRELPEGEVFQCSNQHYGCQPCVESLNVKLCQCSEYFDRKRPNPIDELLQEAKIACPFKKFGCTWMFKQAEMSHHQEECKFRPYECITKKLGLFRCQWNGFQMDIEEHLKNDHAEFGSAFTYFQELDIPFNESKSTCSLKVVDAFSKLFLFHYSLKVSTKMVYFMIIYFGRREEAQQYFYELEIRSKQENEIRRIKFVENCVADCEDIQGALQASKCAAIQFDAARNFCHEGKIHVRFILKKFQNEQEKSGRERKLSTNNTNHDSKPKTKPTPFKFPDKGSMKPNVKRTGSNVTPAPNNKGPEKKPNSKPEDLPSIQRQSTSDRKITNADDPPVAYDYSSSINKVGVSGQDSPLLHQEPCPLMSPSINRHNARGHRPPSYCTLTSTEFCQSIGENAHVANRPPPGECKTTATLCQRYTQPYKMTDDRLYLQRHPLDCLGKPVLRR
ncbi:E3 ubiquitin-protein ligase siah-1-like [Uranotaenia lowii]|uniref:E3 ubiquitin-protein ligase siah-1-like n=1 Tax=Uranotaenia lowii TaxID=190385 RepID=UPI0024795951|nr:E3 ubiquitin-protein ligase siah-1-like [Uranotaenia lowii]XP_055595842.1 E3 ubiquitin-protein ligase siah-1-like [Uranotaenia lowii]XP_055595844.1 E3 ubiquitin-protein ligase siah-1-like [Uranotaenia lowii]XP_055595845.1 E3 ubiquitin-protein ligase siah-1-like [Uranotaenia lowii]